MLPHSRSHVINHLRSNDANFSGSSAGIINSIFKLLKYKLGPGTNAVIKSGSKMKCFAHAVTDIILKWF